MERAGPGHAIDKPVSYQHFVKIWNDVFPHVKIREWKSVTGKCSECEMLSKLRHSTMTNAKRQYYKNLHLIHRNHTRGEKLDYYKRIQEAKESDGEVISFIFDGMSSSSTALPNLASLNQWSIPFKTHLQGCIAHGRHTSFYWSYPNLMTGASFMIHCILCEIEKIIKSEAPLPRRLYIQIDGGPENSARSVIAFFEHLVLLGGTLLVKVTRLMVGHTHEDIDSRFGRIWVKIRYMHVYTPQEMEEAIKNAFPSTDQEINVIHVIAICNYKDFYEKFIDDNVQNYR